MATRNYRQTRRAEQQARTRQRIVEALVALHGEIGPAQTTVSALAKRAGVERLTVYRHFPDENAMFQACSAHFATQVPPPDPTAWARATDPTERLRAALLAFYDYYRRAEPTLTHVFRDAPRLPPLAAVLAPWAAFVAAVRDELREGWGVRSEPARARLAASVGHALRFETWQSLARREALGGAEAAELMVRLAQAAVSSTPVGPAAGTTAD